MEYEQDNDYDRRDTFVELPIHRVKKKRVLTEKQRENWARALEVRKKNIQMRKKAKEEINKLERDQLMNDPDLKNREKRLKDLLLTILSLDEKRELPHLASHGSPNGPSKPIRGAREPVGDVENVIIKRCNSEPLGDYREEKHDDVEKEGAAENLYKPFVKLPQGRKAKTSRGSPRLQEPVKQQRKWADESEDDEPDVNIFKD